MRRVAMNTLWVVIFGTIVIYLAYNFYAKRIDREVIQADPKRATPARMYNDGVDFMPASRNVLYGYHFKSIAAAGPIVGVITGVNLWGWTPSILWLLIGVSFIGWASDYSAIMVAVRNEGNSLSAIAHRLISPRTRTILFLFIFFYLLLIAAAFVGILAPILVGRPDVPFGVFVLALMGLLAGQMLNKMKVDLVLVTLVVVVVTILAMALGPLGVNLTKAPVDWSQGPISGAIVAINKSVDSGGPLYTVIDPTNADTRIPPPGADGKRPTTLTYDAATGAIKVLPSYLLWALFLLVFSYLGANLPIWRFAQPVNYIGFWITGLVIVGSGIGAVLAPFLNPAVAVFKSAAFKGFFPPQPAGALQPLWPMLFVTIACGAISGWHALIGSVGTARQIDNETDMLPVGGGAMLSEFALGLLARLALATASQPKGGAPQFADGIGGFLSVIGIPLAYGTAIGFTAFVVIVITVVQLVFRVMRVTLAEGLGDRSPIFRNIHFGTLISMAATFLLVITGTWVYIWQLFGASNQLMAALSLLVVTVWLAASRRNPTYALIPTLFMYITTMAATLVTAYNLYATVFIKQLGQPGTR